MGRLADLWARLRGKRPPPALPPANVWRSRVAVHEAGHVVAAWCCTAVRDVMVDVHDEHAGVVTYALRRAMDWQDHWAAMVIDLAGIAAENHVFRSFRTGESRDDLVKALDRARWFVRSGGRRAQSSERGVVPFAKLFVPPIGQSEALALGAAYEEAKKLVVGHGERYFRLVSLIMVCPRLSERQLQQALGSRLPMVLLHKLGVNRFLSPNG